MNAGPYIRHNAPPIMGMTQFHWDDFRDIRAISNISQKLVMVEELLSDIERLIPIPSGITTPKNVEKQDCPNSEARGFKNINDAIDINSHQIEALENTLRILREEYNELGSQRIRLLQARKALK